MNTGINFAGYIHSRIQNILKSYSFKRIPTQITFY